MNMIHSKLVLYSLCRKPDDATNKYYAKKKGSKLLSNDKMELTFSH